jgi:hypothetical protein
MSVFRCGSIAPSIGIVPSPQQHREIPPACHPRAQPRPHLSTQEEFSPAACPPGAAFNPPQMLTTAVHDGRCPRGACQISLAPATHSSPQRLSRPPNHATRTPVCSRTQPLCPQLLCNAVPPASMIRSSTNESCCPAGCCHTPPPAAAVCNRCSTQAERLTAAAAAGHAAAAVQPAGPRALQQQ